MVSRGEQGSTEQKGLSARVLQASSGWEADLTGCGTGPALTPLAIGSIPSDPFRRRPAGEAGSRHWRNALDGGCGVDQAFVDHFDGGTHVGETVRLALRVWKQVKLLIFDRELDILDITVMFSSRIATFWNCSTLPACPCQDLFDFLRQTGICHNVFTLGIDEVVARNPFGTGGTVASATPVAQLSPMLPKTID